MEKRRVQPEIRQPDVPSARPGGTMTTTCHCHAPAVFGHRADCPDGHRFLQPDHPLVKPLPLRSRRIIADQEQAQWDAPLQTEDKP
jgi:hypothetical protein